MNGDAFCLSRISPVREAFEHMFFIPGLGRESIDAVTARDYNTIMGATLSRGIYFAEVVQDDNRQMIQIVKSE